MPIRVPFRLNALLLERFVFQGQKLIGCENSGIGQTRFKFREWFGASPELCIIPWLKIKRKKRNRLPRRASPKHLLWALLFAKQYPKESLLKKLCGAEPKTIRKWVWWVLKSVASLGDDEIKWEDRFVGNTRFRNKVTVDGTDFRIREPGPFNKKWYSHKFKAAGLRYEVGICIKTGFLVWVHGPFPCGSYPDITIFRGGLKHVLQRGVERVEADRGYRGEPYYISVPDDFRNENEKVAKGHARARQEHVNRRFKEYSALQQVFRHHRKKHSTLFWAVAVVTQIALKSNEKLNWKVKYTGETYTEFFPR